MTRRLLLSYLSLTAFVLLVLEIPLGTTFARHERSVLVSNLERDGTVVASFAEDKLETGKTADLQPIARRVASETGSRVVVVDAKGQLVADSDVAGALVDRDFSTRPEIAQALKGQTTTGSRYSQTLHTNLLYVVVPIASGGEIHGAVRLSYTTARMDARVRRNWLTLALVGVVALGATSIVGWLLARSVTRPLHDLRGVARAVAEGKLSARASIKGGPPETVALAHTFNDMAAQLESLVGAQRSFIADASHQLRTPMTALRLRLENLEASVGPQDREEVRAALRESARLSRIVDGLLALARAEASHAERATLELGPIVDERRDAWAPLAEERGVHLVASATGDPRALIVPGHVEQILDNLLANAIEVAPRGSSVAIRATAEPRWIELHVVDQGPGMAAEERARAFDRFWRGPHAEGSSGSGLGLPIVRQLAVANGGDAELREADGGGLDAVVRLPPVEAVSRTHALAH